MAKSLETPEDGVVRIYDVYCPNSQYTGVRNKIGFYRGHAQLPEPHPVDFEYAADYKKEYEAFKEILHIFRSDYGYDISYREVVASEPQRLAPAGRGKPLVLPGQG